MGYDTDAKRDNDGGEEVEKERGGWGGGTKTMVVIRMVALEEEWLMRDEEGR